MQETKCGWESIYAQSGEVQRDVLDVAVDAVHHFRTRGIRRVMDLGCGTGRHTAYLARNGFDVVAADIAPTGLAITRDRVRALDLGNVTLVRLDMAALPFSDDSLNGLLCIWTTGHGRLADVRDSVQEMCRVVKPGGLVIADFVSAQDEDCGRGAEIEERTFVGGVEGEEGIAHHYATISELNRLLMPFRETEIRPVTYSHEAWGDKTIRAFLVHAVK